MPDIRYDRIEAYKIINQYSPSPFSRTSAIKLFDALVSGKRRMKGAKLYLYVAMTIQERNYQLLSRELKERLILQAIPHFKRLHEKFKRRV